jgi:peptidoglycan/LPS O-acetylase OafA/YrhL
VDVNGAPGSVRVETSRVIDIARGTAALGVIWGHAIYGFTLPLELNGAFWVWIFLAISGYLVAKSFEPTAYGVSWSGYRHFLWNRALRIVPLAWIALATGQVLELASGQRDSGGAILRQFLFVPPGNAMTLSAALWTVATEIQFYVVSLIVCAVALRWRSRAVAWLLFAASIWLAWRSTAWTGEPTGGQPRMLLGNLPFFMFGIATAAGRHDASARLSGAVMAVGAAAVVGVAWYLNNFRPDYFWHWGSRSWPFGGGAACALIAAALTLWTRLPTLASRETTPRLARAAGWCGFHTYGIYVYHSMLVKTNQTFLGLQPGIGLLAWLLLALAVAPVSYRFIERPLLRLKARRVTGDAYPRAAAVPVLQVMP